ncbi:MAG: energy transducer TonB [Algoriphagus sp.]|uniref:energy transducer TonB n=1 Tax=Algoriphagus sp. TaxID=1872435 RepID=UPI0018343421|nr:energy transducer TonB [Algoriphagus sp.]NVJ85593.1 energy transducer TonB [Algoriphagus sp.]
MKYLINRIGGIAFVLFFLGTAQMVLAQESIVSISEMETLDSPPKPPGGMDGWITHIATNLKYPTTARSKKIEGTVVLKFVIEKDGSISETQVLRGIGGGCDEEALRVLKLSPNWTPGIKEDQPVRTEMRLPIRFKLG